jgi:hypothetical protein
VRAVPSVLEGRLCLGYVDLIASDLLDVTEDGSTYLLLVLLQTDVVYSVRDDQIVDFRKRPELVLEGVIGER